MKPSPENAVDVLNELRRLTESCESGQQTVAEITARLEELGDESRRAEEQMRRKAQTQQSLQGERIRTACRTQLQALEDTTEQSIHNAEANEKQQIEAADSELRSVTTALRSQRESELWVLQSVYDESAEDTPQLRFERASETFDAQREVVEEKLSRLRLRMEESAQLLERCYARVAISPLDASAPAGTRDELRENVLSAIQAGFEYAEKTETSSAVTWNYRFRPWVLSFVLLFIVTVAMIPVRIAPSALLNPDLEKPDQGWIGVSVGAGAATGVLTLVLLIFTGQGRLRRSFDLVRSSAGLAINGHHAWERKGRQDLKRLRKEAEVWKTRVEAERAERAHRIEENILSKTAQAEEQREAVVEAARKEASESISALRSHRIQASAKLEQERDTALLTLQSTAESDLRIQSEQLIQETQNQSAQLSAQRAKLLARWKSNVEEARAITDLCVSRVADGRRWPRINTGVWDLPNQFPSALPAGDLLLSIPSPPLHDNADGNSSSHLCLDVPVPLTFPQELSSVIDFTPATRETAERFATALLLKILSRLPAGRVRLTLIDPLGLGHAFSALMHLTDYDEHLVSGRIWTDPNAIRDRLKTLTEQMESIYQNYLRSEFESIEEYNKSAGEVAEPYHIVLFAGFPTGLTDEASRFLSSILHSGPRCGVYPIILRNPALHPPQSFDPSDCDRAALHWKATDSGILPVIPLPARAEFEPLAPPDSETMVAIIRRIGELSATARRIEVPFSRIAPKEDRVWSESAAHEIRLPIGRAGAARLQQLRLGKGTSQHVLIAGRTGSGKSTLMHILITNMALYYSPNEVHFFLIDFKKGVEFRTYAAHRLPHARVVAIESDREFGLSVLERLDHLLQERGDLFRNRGVQDIPGWREQFPDEPMPRLLLLIDEFQEFFVAEDRISSRASLLLDRLVRQGRAFGIHVILGSQTLGGAYSLARSTLGQVAIRVALQCSEGDAHLILSEDNTAARMLSRPGDAIYNDANGLKEGNHPFQVGWLDEELREEKIQSLLTLPNNPVRSDEGMIVFEGTIAPAADLCRPLTEHLRQLRNASQTGTATATQGSAPDLWLGEPVAIADPTRIELKRASGQNLLLVGPDARQADSLLAMALLSCPSAAPAATDQTRTFRTTLLSAGSESQTLTEFSKFLGTSRPELISEGDVPELVQDLLTEIEQREAQDTANTDSRLILIRDLAQFRDLRRPADDFGFSGFGEAKPQSIAQQFGDLLTRGPSVGIHFVIWADTFGNTTRWLSTQLIREFDYRIAFRMNQTDSASLIDSPQAAQLSAGRALLYRDQTGLAEKFRPFSFPESSWVSSLSVSDSSAQSSDDHPDIDSLRIE